MLSVGVILVIRTQEKTMGKNILLTIIQILYKWK